MSLHVHILVLYRSCKNSKGRLRCRFTIQKQQEPLQCVTSVYLSNVYEFYIKKQNKTRTAAPQHLRIAWMFGQLFPRPISRQIFARAFNDPFSHYGLHVFKDKVILGTLKALQAQLHNFTLVCESFCPKP